MKLIADSGSTKTTWYVEGKEQTIKTAGINPYYQSEEEIGAELGRLCVQVTEHIDEIHFYGAGCTAQKRDMLQRIFEAQFPNATIEIESDLVGAARALLQHESGIACILGTGSNSCLYDGEKIVENVSPLGFILGDEGSGAVIGKLFVNACFKNSEFAKIKAQFLETQQITVADIIEHVYRQAFPNRYLAHFMPFVASVKNEPCVHKLVVNCFCDFFEKNIAHYPNAHKQKLAFTGSVAYHFADELKEATTQCGYTISKIEAEPIEGLKLFHTKN